MEGRKEEKREGLRVRAPGEYLKIGVLHDIFGTHPVQNEFRFVGNADDVILHGVRQQPNATTATPNALINAINIHGSELVVW